MGLFDSLMTCKKCGKGIFTARDSFTFVDGLYCYTCGREKQEEYKLKLGRLRDKRKKNPTITLAKNKNWNELITPINFEDYIGQESIKRELRTMLAANKVHSIPIQHVLFSGSFGLGKTTIAKIFADNIGENDIVTAVNIRNYENFSTKPVVVVDEIHTLADEEGLLGIMDRSGQTILAATTTAGTLSGPLRCFISITTLYGRRVESNGAWCCQ